MGPVRAADAATRAEASQAAAVPREGVPRVDDPARAEASRAPRVVRGASRIRAGRGVRASLRRPATRVSAPWHRLLARAAAVAPEGAAVVDAAAAVAGAADLVNLKLI